MTHLPRIAELMHQDSNTCVVVESGVDMAAILARASPSRARSFAIAMHERACAAYDETALAFWCDVLTALTLNGPSGGTWSDGPSPRPSAI
jgi:hypothetical protein